MEIIFLLAFKAFLLGAAVISWQAGDHPDRKIIALIVVVASGPAVSHALFDRQVAFGLVLLTDLLLLFMIVRYAFASQRHWPIWFAGFHAVICLLDILSLLMPSVGIGIGLISGFWCLVALSAMVAGLLRDRRHNVENA